MTLRVRLLLGYGYLVALLLLAAGSAMVGFLYLSEGIEGVLEDNFQSIQAAMTMIDALERQDSATLAALIERRAEVAEIEDHERVFDEALGEAGRNVTEDGEPEAIAEIQDAFAAYREARNRLVASQPATPLAAYKQEVFPRFAAVKAAVVELLAINQRAMFEADRQARQGAIQSGTWIGLLVVIALVSLVFLSRAMQRQILVRVERLASGMAAITAGHRRLREEGDDELAKIAHQVNRLLDQYDELRGHSQGRLAQERRLVQGLVAGFGSGSALFSLSGELLAGELGAPALERRVAEWIREEGRTRSGADERVSTTVEAEGGSVEIELVVAPGERPTAWLAR
jgi:hypothetical protein